MVVVVLVMVEWSSLALLSSSVSLEEAGWVLARARSFGVGVMGDLRDRVDGGLVAEDTLDWERVRASPGRSEVTVTHTLPWSSCKIKAY